ncbi:MAG: glutathione S-transferase family protein [Hyphomicrobiaceae bacterium]
MKIIEQERAPNPRRVKIFLAEKGLDIPFEKLQINKAEHRAPEFTALNPMQRVPVLVLDDGTAISESVAICRYFEELHPEPNLFGRTALEKAMVEMWNRRMDLGLLFHVSQCFRHKHPAMAEMEVPQITEWGDANRPRAYAVLDVLNETLAVTPYVAGDNYSIADITAMVAIDFMKPARLELPDSLQNVHRWYGEMAQRPSSKLH